MEDSATKVGQLETLASQAGVHPARLELLMRRCRWSRERLTQIAESHQDWFAQLSKAAFDAEVAGRVGGTGPRWFQELTDDQSLKLIKSDRLRRFAAEFEPKESAILLGETEAGKTLSALVVLRKHRRRAESRRMQTRDTNWLEDWDNRGEWGSEEQPSLVHDGFVTAGDLALLSRMHRLGQDEPRDLRRAKSSPLLVVDDISTPHARIEVTWAVIEARNNAALPTIVTGGIPLAELYRQFGDAGVRRMLQVRGRKGVVVDLFGGGSK